MKQLSSALSKCKARVRKTAVAAIGVHEPPVSLIGEFDCHGSVFEGTVMSTTLSEDKVMPSWLARAVLSQWGQEQIHRTISESLETVAHGF